MAEFEAPVGLYHIATHCPATGWTGPHTWTTRRMRRRWRLRYHDETFCARCYWCPAIGNPIPADVTAIGRPH